MLNVVVIGSREWDEMLAQQKRQADALERIAAAVEKNLDLSQQLAALTLKVQAETGKLSNATPAS